MLCEQFCVILPTELLQVVDKLGLSFHNVRALHKKIDAMPDRAGSWQTKFLTFRDLPDEEFTIWKISESQKFCLPAPSSVWHSINFFMQCADIVEGEPKL